MVTRSTDVSAVCDGCGRWRPTMPPSTDEPLPPAGPQSLTAGLFTCGACGGTFTKAWSDEEARAEANAIGFRDQSAVVCDPCYVEMMAWAKREGIDLG